MFLWFDLVIIQYPLPRVMDSTDQFHASIQRHIKTAN